MFSGWLCARRCGIELASHSRQTLADQAFGAGNSKPRSNLAMLSRSDSGQRAWLCAAFCRSPKPNRSPRSWRPSFGTRSGGVIRPICSVVAQARSKRRRAKLKAGCPQALLRSFLLLPSESRESLKPSYSSLRGGAGVGAAGAGKERETRLSSVSALLFLCEALDIDQQLQSHSG